MVQHTLEGKEQVVGHMPVWDDDVVDALRYVEALLHCNEALAQLGWPRPGGRAGRAAADGARVVGTGPGRRISLPAAAGKTGGS